MAQRKPSKGTRSVQHTLRKTPGSPCFRCLKRSPNTRRLAGRSPMVQHQPLRPRTCQTRMRLLSATPIALALQENKGRGQPAHGWEPWWKVNPSSRWLRHLGVSRNLGTLFGMVSRGKAKGNHPPEEVVLRNTHLVFNHVFLLFSFKQKEGGKRWNFGFEQFQYVPKLKGREGATERQFPKSTRKVAAIDAEFCHHKYLWSWCLFVEE